MNSDFMLAIRQIEREREIPPLEIQGIIEDALVKSIQQESEGLQSINVEFDIESGRLSIMRIREVVETVYTPALEISYENALRVNDEVEIGDLVETPVSPLSFRRIGVQAVKQHIIQRVREMEKNIQLERFVDREGQIITGTVSRITNNGVLVNLDRIDGLLPREDRIPGENYSIGKRLKVLVLEVRTGTRDGEIILSRAHPDFVKKLFQLEVPEIAQNIVQIKAIMREAGYRTKMAVISTQDKVDPVGACVGYKGSRVKNIVNELNGEKIDIIPWDEDPAQFIAHALSPAQVISVEVFDDHSAEVIVPDNQLSLAIGKQGQNARLANKLTGWKIDILSDAEKERLLQELRLSDLYETGVDELSIAKRTLNILKEKEINTFYDLACMTEEDLKNVDGLGEKSVQELKSAVIESGFKLLEEGEEKPSIPPGLKISEDTMESEEISDKKLEERAEDAEIRAIIEMADNDKEQAEPDEIPEEDEPEEELEDEQEAPVEEEIEEEGETEDTEEL
ncbi:MAG TPA: transcription termination factor NusA [bacterium]|nr:transcription termination factor NusA [bacterium]